MEARTSAKAWRLDPLQHQVLGLEQPIEAAVSEEHGCLTGTGPRESRYQEETKAEKAAWPQVSWLLCK